MTDQYGPNTEEVERLIASIHTVTPEQSQALDAAWKAARGNALGAAWDAAWDATRYAGLFAAGYAAWKAARGNARDAARDAAWHAARHATRHAALALVVRDRISKEHFDILAGPWVSVMGRTWEKQRQPMTSYAIECPFCDGPTTADCPACNGKGALPLSERDTYISIIIRTLPKLDDDDIADLCANVLGVAEALEVTP